MKTMTKRVFSLLLALLLCAGLLPAAGFAEEPEDGQPLPAEAFAEHPAEDDVPEVIDAVGTEPAADAAPAPAEAGETDAEADPGEAAADLERTKLYMVITDWCLQKITRVSTGNTQSSNGYDSHYEFVEGNTFTFSTLESFDPRWSTSYRLEDGTVPQSIDPNGIETSWEILRKDIGAPDSEYKPVVYSSVDNGIYGPDTDMDGEGVGASCYKAGNYKVVIHLDYTGDVYDMYLENGVWYFTVNKADNFSTSGFAGDHSQQYGSEIFDEYGIDKSKAYFARSAIRVPAGAAGSRTVPLFASESIPYDTRVSDIEYPAGSDDISVSTEFLGFSEDLASMTTGFPLRRRMSSPWMWYDRNYNITVDYPAMEAGETRLAYIKLSGGQNYEDEWMAVPIVAYDPASVVPSSYYFMYENDLSKDYDGLPVSVSLDDIGVTAYDDENEPLAGVGIRDLLEAGDLRLAWVDENEDTMQEAEFDGNGVSTNGPKKPGEYQLVFQVRGNGEGWEELPVEDPVPGEVPGGEPDGPGGYYDAYSVWFDIRLSFSEAAIDKVSNYSHYYQTSQYYEGAFVVWKEHITIDGIPIQAYDESTGITTENYTDEQLEEMGITVEWRDENGDPAIIDYDRPNSNFYTGPARTGTYTAVVTQTIGDETLDISEPVEFEILPTVFTKFTDYDSNITSGARYYLYSIVGEIDGQLYVMAMPELEASLRMTAIPVTPDEDGRISLGANRENVFMLKRDAHSYGDDDHPSHNLYHLTTGTSLDTYITGSSGAICRGTFSLTGDDGFYINTDPDNNYAADIFEPHMGHGAFCLVRDGEGSVFFTREMWSTGFPSPDLGEVEEYPVYLYWNQVPAEPIGSHEYEFLGTPYDKDYDGEPIFFDPYKNISVDGGKTGWGELEKMGTARIAWKEWQGKTPVEIEGPPSAPGMYQVVIQELDEDGKIWTDVLSETFFINASEPPDVHGDMDGDGEVTANDLRRLLRYVNGQAVELAVSGDVNGDGVINTADLLRLLKYLQQFDVMLN